MLRVPGKLESLRSAGISSGMHPPLRVTLSPVAKFTKVEPSSGPPVPARIELGSLELGHPNCAMKLGRREATNKYRAHAHVYENN